MEDANLIACLYPVDRYATTDRALHTIRMRENKRYHFVQPFVVSEGMHGESETERRMRGQGEGEGEEEGEEEEKEEEEEEGEEEEGEEEIEEHERHLRSEGIQLRFDQHRKNKQGFLIGSNKHNCDIVLPTEPSLSCIGEHQCLITFDECGRLILRDLRDPDAAKTTQDGTIVTYDGGGKHPRRGFTWILSGERFTEKKVEVWFHRRIRFLLVAAPHDIHSVEYLEKIVEFRRKETTLSSDRLSLQQGLLEVHDPLLSSTSLKKEQHLLLGEPILLDDICIGDGGQAVVKRVWDVSTGLQYASKEPIGIKEKHWRCFKREAKLLKQLQHSNIIKCMYITQVPKRRAILEYLPLGSLNDQAKKRPISSSENLQVLIQGLAALCFLHKREKPIAHRDIKPDNILVRSRDPLHIKLSDFGLSKLSQQVLKTYCGTERYMAPEIQYQETYDKTVDIWSLGLVALQYAHGFPSSRVMTGLVWAERITKHLKDKFEADKCPLLGFLQQHMLRIDPGERSWAFRCSMVARKLKAPGCCAQRAIAQTEIDPTSEDDDLTYYTVTPDNQRCRRENLSLLVEGVQEKTAVENHTTGADTLPQNKIVRKQSKMETTAIQTISPTPPQSPKPTKGQCTSVIRASKEPSASAAHAPQKKSPAISRKRRHEGSDTYRHGKRFKFVTMHKRPSFSWVFRSEMRCTQSMVESLGESFWVLPKFAMDVPKKLDFPKEAF